MALKTRVFVSDVDNLGDGRYCAGMGVEMIGFPIEASHKRYVSPDKFKEIAGWLAGIKFVGEVYESAEINFDDYEAIDVVITDNAALINDLSKSTKPLIYKIAVTDIDEAEQQMSLLDHQVDYFLLEFAEDLSDELLNKIHSLTEEYKVFIAGGFNEDSVNTLLETAKPEGIALKGGSEVAVGVNTFDGLVEVIEAIEDWS
ncbi:beta/alpha barrel domain-containing protein [Flammeovirga kamogawensis]|uniref:Phosphoribosylanthranilate isomerase n=1 Tax=Flammeovirga kamogawensis TaxID=373891 RepID=A0ABX8H081_9BACT|nr:hypothetical protein [Flammeovirga kamogawensis]MBB6459171.1 phosphoribosylanthranilate isomerase [Flammeovirga kamogawensis]QWG08737.1 hypothetical protein KM029_07300 [Flammeovirga kamogawensis]TRX67030.1 hypothetical protein EO216_02345 [Flammeovirga kamogawensis]